MTGREHREPGDGRGNTFDFVVVGSGFGGSVSAMRLAEKGYHVLVLEQGKRYRDHDYPTSNWIVWKYLWLPALRFFGILKLTLFKGVLVMTGTGVGGGSLAYANVLVEPDDRLFDTPGWRELGNWKEILEPHYRTAKRMLGVTTNTKMWPADEILEEIAEELGGVAGLTPTQVGVFFGEPDREVEDPYFGGEGPRRSGCNFCGGCMVGCRYNAKNSLDKNYLFFAEKRGVDIREQSKVTEIRQVEDESPDGARYEVVYRSLRLGARMGVNRVRARNVVLSGGVLGTLRLLFHCRDVGGTMRRISHRLGDDVRTNNEEFTGATCRNFESSFSKGVAITSILKADRVTHVEPVRFPEGSALLLAVMGVPLIEVEGGFLRRLGKLLGEAARHPLDFIKTKVLPKMAKRSTILMAMQTEDSKMRLRFGRSLFTLYQRGLVSVDETECIPPATVDIAHRIARRFAEKSDGVPLGSLSQALFDVPTTAHILGGCPMGKDDSEGVIDVNCEVHNYPGLFVVDGSVMPGNPGLNPSLTITALAEHAMSKIPPRENGTGKTMA